MANGHSIPVWTVVELSVPVKETRAERDLPAGTTLSPDDVKESLRDGFPQPSPPRRNTSSPVGLQARRTIKAGEIVRPEFLTAPVEIRRGDRVRVEVESGEASIGVEAVASADARAGQTVLLTNESSGKRFKAVATGPRRASIHLEKNHVESTDRSASVSGDRTAAAGSRLEETAGAVRVGQTDR
jgi:flagella basal body P-ring formation protein FlgA